LISFSLLQVFGDIMIDYTYVELTSAALQALAAFRTHFPTHRPVEVAAAIERGGREVRKFQR